MQDRKELILACKQLQEFVYEFVARDVIAMRPEFIGKVVKVVFCCDLVLEDLDELYYKRHFSFDMAPSLMALYPNPDWTIPLSFCMYVDRVPVAYAIGDISDVNNAFEIHFCETSNFYGNKGLIVWLEYVLEILAALQVVLERQRQLTLDKICFINPVPSAIGPLVSMGFDVTHQYGGSQSAAILKLQVK